MTHLTYFCRLSCHVYHGGVCLTVFYDCFTAKKGQNNGTLLKNWSQIFTSQGQKRHNTLKSCYLLNTPPAYYEGSDKRRTLEYPQTFR